MYNTILAPLDGSKRAEAILSYVESLAKSYGARLIFLGVVEPLVIGHTSIYQNPLFDQHNLQRQIEEVEGYLDYHVKSFSYKGIEVIKRIVVGTVVEEIIQTADQEQADLIAMTSHGRTGLSHVFYGSVAVGVLHRVDRPLLLIRSLDNQTNG